MSTLESSMDDHSRWSIVITNRSLLTTWVVALANQWLAATRDTIQTILCSSDDVHDSKNYDLTLPASGVAGRHRSTPGYHRQRRGRIHRWSLQVACFKLSSLCWKKKALPTLPADNAGCWTGQCAACHGVVTSCNTCTSLLDDETCISTASATCRRGKLHSRHPASLAKRPDRNRTIPAALKHLGGHAQGPALASLIATQAECAI